VNLDKLLLAELSEFEAQNDEKGVPKGSSGKV